MLDALETYLAAGGRLMYLGGNGFYWVTAMDAERPHLIEIRRGTSGTRSWSSEPGEMRLSLTGEPGGLGGTAGGRRTGSAASASRRRGGTPRPATAVSPTAAIGAPPSSSPVSPTMRSSVTSGSSSTAPLATRSTADDLELGTPPETLRLATSEGGHSDAYQLVIEDSTDSRPDLGGTTCPKVRSDLVYSGAGRWRRGLLRRLDQLDRQLAAQRFRQQCLANHRERVATLCGGLSRQT